MQRENIFPHRVIITNLSVMRGKEHLARHLLDIEIGNLQVDMSPDKRHTTIGENPFTAILIQFNTIDLQSFELSLLLPVHLHRPIMNTLTLIHKKTRGFLVATQ